MRKAIGVLVASAMLVVLTAAPALADRPITFTETFGPFTDVNPCTELPDEFTIHAEISLHEHNSNVVISMQRTGSTASGFTMIAGTESLVFNNNVERGAFSDQWRHPDGSKFKAQGQFVFNINKGELLLENFSLTCIGNG